MAKKKPMKPAKSIKKVAIKLPIPPEHKDAEVVIEPVHLPDVPDEHLAESVGPVRCRLVVRDSFWSGAEYVVIAPVTGQVFPEALKTGMQVDVQFLPSSPAEKSEGEKS